MYFLLANAILVVHLVVPAILVIGLGAIIPYQGKPRRRWQLLYFGSWLGVFLSHVLTGRCILTELEKKMWEGHMSGSSYDGTFFDNYFPFISTFVNRYGIWIVLAGGLTQLLILAVTVSREKVTPV